MPNNSNPSNAPVNAKNKSHEQVINTRHTNDTFSSPNNHDAASDGLDVNHHAAKRHSMVVEREQQTTGQADAQTDDSPYAAYHAHQTNSHKQGANWLWIVPLMLITLLAGLFAGRFWADKQHEKAALNAPRNVTPQIATATGVTEINTGGAASASIATVDDPDNTDTIGSKVKPVLTVEAIKPKRSIIDNTLTANGTISPKNVATVNGKINGVVIDKVLVQEGDYVKAGQVLAVFDNDALTQQSIQAQADLAEARTRFELAKKDADRVLPLLEIKAVSEQEADRYIATANQAAAAAAAAEARFNTQQLNMENAKIVAPVSGIISEKNAHVGAVPGQAPLFTIIENGVLEWQAQVDPNNIGDINVGTPVQVNLPKNSVVMGKVSRIAPTTEKGSRQITIYATLANHPNARAGMYQRGIFNLGQEADLTIPVSSVVSEDGYDYVMRIKAIKDAKRNTVYQVEKIKVSLGERLGDKVVLTKPLPGDGNIVRQGGSFLNDGDMVRLAGNNGGVS